MRALVEMIAWHYSFIGESTPNKTIWQKIYTNGMKLACTYFFILDGLFRRYFGKINELSKDNNRPVISLTSYPQRIKSLWMVIDSIYLQTYLPKKIILVLTKEEFPNMMESVPKSLKRYLGKGLEIVFTNYNLRSHNKYYYTMSNIDNSDVITIDDDLIYWSNTIELLYKIKQENPGCICANRVTQVCENDGHLFFQSKYNSRGHSLIARGTGGVLYPPRFRPKNLFDQEQIKKLSLSTDDNWLKVHEMKCGIKVATGDFYPHPLVFPGSQKAGLHKDNRSKELKIHENLLTEYKLRDNYNKRFL